MRAAQLRELKKHQPIEVIWVDAFYDLDTYWQSTKSRGGSSTDEGEKIRSIGVYISHDSRWLRMAQSLNSDLEIGGVHHIPVAVIETVKTLR